MTLAIDRRTRIVTAAEILADIEARGGESEEVDPRPRGYSRPKPLPTFDVDPFDGLRDSATLASQSVATAMGVLTTHVYAWARGGQLPASRQANRHHGYEFRVGDLRKALLNAVAGTSPVAGHGPTPPWVGNTAALLGSGCAAARAETSDASEVSAR